VARSVSDEWRSLLTRSREFVARVEVLDADGTPVFTTEPTSDVNRVRVAGLSITVDETRTIRGDAHCEIAVPAGETSVVPSTATAILSPLSGATFRVWAGFRVPSTGQPELVPCGRYDIETCDITETAQGVRIELEGQDLTGRLDVADITTPGLLSIFGSEKLFVCELLVRPVLPTMPILTVPSGQTTGWIFVDDMNNRLSEITEILTSMGYAMWMDPDGFSLHMEPRATTEDTASWVYDTANFKVVGSVKNNLSRRRVYNGVVTKGETTSSDVPPVRAEAWDIDPTSPTYYDPANPGASRIGPRPYFMTSQYIVDQNQANWAAIAELIRLRGLLQQVTVRVGINPAINVGDVVHVERPGIGVIGRYVVQSTSMNLSDPDQMELVCEERRVAVT
jgi:hypothetical protein